MEELGLFPRRKAGCDTISLQLLVSGFPMIGKTRGWDRRGKNLDLIFSTKSILKHWNRLLRTLQRFSEGDRNKVDKDLSEITEVLSCHCEQVWVRCLLEVPLLPYFLLLGVSHNEDQNLSIQRQTILLLCSFDLEKKGLYRLTHKTKF